MKDTFISFYLKNYRIHVFISALHGIGCPPRICFMISSDGKSLLLIPYGKRDLKSHGVSPQVYHGNMSCEIHSYKLCHVLASLYHWDLNRSYRIPGWIDSQKQVAVFDLVSAKIIDQPEIISNNRISD